MNRTLRRQQERQNNKLDKTYTYSKKELDKIIYDVIRQTKIETIKVTTDMWEVVLKRVMRDKFGFGSVRLTRLMAEIKNTMECLSGDYISLKDLKELENGE